MICSGKTWEIDQNAAYFHYTSADTRQGLEIRDFDFDAIPSGSDLIHWVELCNRDCRRRHCLWTSSWKSLRAVWCFSRKECIHCIHVDAAHYIEFHLELISSSQRIVLVEGHILSRAGMPVCCDASVSWPQPPIVCLA